MAVSALLENVVPNSVPFNDAIDDEVKPVPVIVVVKMPSGNCPFEPAPVITGVDGIKVTVAVALPFGPVAVTLSVPVDDIVVGAVYSPELVIVPKVAVQADPPAEANCWVAPRLKETVAGEIVCGFRACSVTTAEAEPPGPVAVTVTELDDGMLEGAVNRPLVVMLPAVAVQLVAPGEVNCCVAPSFKETVTGEIVCGFRACSVTAAEAEPPGPVAVTVTELDDGIVEGAVNRPLVLMVPAVAVQVVAPGEVNCCVAPSFKETVTGEIVSGLRACSVTTAEAEPPGPVAVTVTELDEGIVEGAVNRPLVLMVPAVAVQVVAPGEVNCCVAPSFKETVTGEIVWGLRACRFTTAEAEPPDPVAVAVTELDSGIVEGAVNRPVALMLPAVAVQLVAPDEVNCCMAPSFTVAVVGEMVCFGGGPLAPKVALKAGPHNVPGFST